MFDKNEREMKKIDKSMERLEASIHENACEIGHLFYNANKEKEDLDGIYRERMDVIRRLEEEKKELFREKLKLQGLMQCEYCNGIISYGSTFCNHCGQKLGTDDTSSDKKICQFCGVSNEEDADFCVGCGKRINERNGEA